MGRTIGETQAAVDSREFAEWLAYDSIEPGEPLRGDVRAAMIGMLIAETNRDTKKKPTPFKLEDFMFRFGESDKDRMRRMRDETKQKLMIWKGMVGAGVKKEEKRAMKKAGKKI
jgi:hypothetical protein